MDTEKEVRVWFGERGHPFNEKSKLRFKSMGHWIFIHDSLDEYDEVELYPTNSLFVEPYEGWKRKGFSWAKNNLLKLIPKEDEIRGNMK
tara:strand:+ start:409 stop:675 length:267 start_codon:yes stop_codon:yes gene_type:complete